jgi:hypothetical protein
MKIYTLENKNNIPFYVGKSTNPSHRFYNHSKTYGSDVILKIIDDVDDNEWKFWEKYWIGQFKSWGFNLLNKNKGGGGPDKGRKLRPKDKEWKNKIGASNKGKPKSIECRQKMSIKAKGKAKTQEHIDKIKLGQSNMCDEDRKKWGNNISKSKQGLKYNLSQETKNKLSLLRSKPIIQYDLEGNFIKKWKNRQDASEELNINSNSIYNCCSNRSNTAGGFVFKIDK